jgi:hypothetical protein
MLGQRLHAILGRDPVVRQRARRGWIALTDAMYLVRGPDGERQVCRPCVEPCAFWRHEEPADSRPNTNAAGRVHTGGCPPAASCARRLKYRTPAGRHRLGSQPLVCHSRRGGHAARPHTVVCRVTMWLCNGSRPGSVIRERYGEEHRLDRRAVAQTARAQRMEVDACAGRSKAARPVRTARSARSQRAPASHRPDRSRIKDWVRTRPSGPCRWAKVTTCPSGASSWGVLKSPHRMRGWEAGRARCA